jgi:hypothetical protein
VLRAFRDLAFERQDIVSGAYAGAVSRSWAGLSYVAKYRRLVALKDRFDPGNLFHRNANLPPSTSAPTPPPPP